MKGLVLCGGLGTRLRPLTHTGAKHLIPVAGKPILFYAIENLVAAGVHEIAIVAGGATRAQIEEAVGSGDALGARLTLVSQEQPRGLADAVASARSFVDDEDFVVYLGDNIIHGGVNAFVESFRAEAAAQVLVAPVPNPERFGVVVLEGDRVTQLVEKPKHHVSHLAIVGMYGFRPAIFDAIGRIRPSARGELEITDAIQALVADGSYVRAHHITDWWADTGLPEDVLEANRLMLLDIDRAIEGACDERCEIAGNVHVGEGSTVTGSLLRGPVWIGRDCVVDSCYIGPYTSVSDGCELRNSEIEHSILLPHCRVLDLPSRLGSSLIGNRVTISRREGPLHALQLVIGDESVLGLV
jgi:glucose-1-phosphate thymidylyltransferase